MLYRVMACWTDPISGKGGGQECSVLLQDRTAGWSPQCPAASWSWGPVRGGDDSQRAVGQPSASRFTLRTLRYCTALPAATAGAATPCGFYTEEAEREHVNGAFQFFSYVLKIVQISWFCSLVPCRLNTVHSGISAFSSCINNDQYRITVKLFSNSNWTKRYSHLVTNAL